MLCSSTEQLPIAKSGMFIFTYFIQSLPPERNFTSPNPGKYGAGATLWDPRSTVIR